MIKFILKRFVSLAISLLIVSILIFLLMHSIPGGPFDEGKMPLPEAVRAKLLQQYAAQGSRRRYNNRKGIESILDKDMQKALDAKDDFFKRLQEKREKVAEKRQKEMKKREKERVKTFTYGSGYR